MRCSRVVLAAAVLLGVLASGCGHDCVEVDLTCNPLYEPTFENVFERTLVPKCGTEGDTCHSVDGHMNGLVFAEIDEAYEELLGLTEDGARLTPFDPSCSEMIMRVSADDADYLMPPGEPLSPQERCALVKWVADGARRFPEEPVDGGTE
jgi:hypothetical protein